MRAKKSLASEPLWGGDTDTRNMLASAEWLKLNRAEQVSKSIELFAVLVAKGEVDKFTRRTPLQSILRHIEDAAHTIRSWHAWGEPSPYGKAVCARLREELICFAAVMRELLRRFPSNAYQVRKEKAKR